MQPSQTWRDLYPFTSHHLVLGGHRYHYLDEGTGPVLLLVHGNPTWSFYWREMVRGLRDRYRVIAVDHLGCGLSDKPSPSVYSYRLAQRVDDLVGLIDALKLDSITLMAHDWGGAIGMGAAVARPDRFGRFVLLNTAAFRSDRMPLRIRACRMPLLGQLAVQGLNLFALAAVRMAVEKPERMTPAIRQGLLAPYDSWSHRAAVWRFVMDVPMNARHPSYTTLTEIETGLAQFAHRPACLIWGMHDWCFSGQFLDRFVQVFPKAEVHRLAEAGHYVIEDAWEEILPIVRTFLERPA